MTNLNNYPHAMDVDQATGKPMQKVSAQIAGSLLEEQLTNLQAVAGVLTFAEEIRFIEIYNRDVTNTGVFLVNNISITVPADSVVDFQIGGTPSKTVTVTGSTSYIVSRYV